MITIGIVLEYEVYETFKASQSDLSCIQQNTNGLKIVTLVTCDSFDDNFRIIVKAKEKI